MNVYVKSMDCTAVHVHVRQPQSVRLLLSVSVPVCCGCQIRLLTDWAILVESGGSLRWPLAIY